MALSSASILTACAASTPSARAPIDLPALPARLVQCERPVLMPEAALTRAQVEQLWARDRAALVKCGYNLAAVVGYYEDLAQRLDAANLRK